MRFWPIAIGPKKPSVITYVSESDNAYFDHDNATQKTAWKCKLQSDLKAIVKGRVAILMSVLGWNRNRLRMSHSIQGQFRAGCHDDAYDADVKLEV